MEPSDGGNQIFIKQEIKEEVIDEEENIWGNQEPICQISIKEESKNSESEHGNEFCHYDDFVDKNASTISNASEILTKCKKCGKYFANKGNLQKHIKTVHERKTNYECNHCGKSFGHPGTQKRHIKNIHKSIKYHKCEICSKEFQNKYKYLNHFNAVHLGNGEEISESEIKNEDTNKSNISHTTEIVKIELTEENYTSISIYYQNFWRYLIRYLIQ